MLADMGVIIFIVESKHKFIQMGLGKGIVAEAEHQMQNVPFSMPYCTGHP